MEAKHKLVLVSINLDISVDRWSVQDESSISSPEKQTDPLEEISGLLFSVLAGQLPGNPLSVRGLEGLGHLVPVPPKRPYHCSTSYLCSSYLCSCSPPELLLKRTHHRDIQCSISAIGPPRNVDICRLSLRP